MGSYFPDQGRNLCPAAVEAESLNSEDHPGIPQADVFVIISFCMCLLVPGTSLVLRSTLHATSIVYTILWGRNVTTQAFF